MGNGLNRALAMANLLKSRQATRLTNKLLDDTLQGVQGMELDAALAGVGIPGGTDGPAIN